MSESPLCPITSPQEDQCDWLRDQSLEMLSDILCKRVDSKYVLQKTSKLLRQRLRNHLNHKNKDWVPLSQALSWINAQQSVEILSQASNIVTRKTLKKRIDERLQALTGEELFVGAFVAKRFLKPGTKTKAIYFGQIDLVYNKNNPDFEDRCCHAIYDDKDAEDFSYSEFLNAKNFFKKSTVIGVNCHTQLFNYVYVKHACLK